VNTTNLSPELIDDMRNAMSQKVADTSIWLNLSCPTCQNHWKSAFDVLNYLWVELEAWAISTLKQIHVLAAHYAWSEREILNLTAWRRRYYMSMIYR
jgi:hypothetical protein